MSQILSAGGKAALLRRMHASPQLHSSAKLRDLLEYLVECAERKHPEEATEQQIGVHVFGKEPGYNSSEDSLVRSQVRLLRLKLAAYFEQDGLGEPVVLLIPKGQYMPCFQLRHIKFDTVESDPPLTKPEITLPDAPEVIPSEPVQKTTAPKKRNWRLLGVGLGAGVVLTLAVLAASTFRHFAGGLGGRLTAKEPLWEPFQTPAAQTLVIYSNPVFIGTPQQGLKLTPSTGANQIEANDQIDDTYTGTGELEAVYRLTRFFNSSDSQFQLKRSRMVTWDEARSRNLIFIGAPSQNTALYDLPSLTQFTIRLDPQSRGYIHNQNPIAPEPATFGGFGNSEEFAIIALLPGLQSGRRILLFAGLTTSGTQASVEFACSPEGEAALMQRAKLDHGLSQPFEAVLHVRTSQHVSIGTEIIAFHRR